MAPPNQDMSAQNTGSTSDVKDFLLEEYRSLSTSLLKNEETGETRVNWFIGIVTATIGGLVTLISSEHGPGGPTLRLIVMACLGGLLVFGIVTLFRMKQRNRVTDGFKKDVDTIREIFKRHFDGDRVLFDYEPFRKKPRVPGLKAPKRKLGGLTDIVSAINSLLLAGVVAAAGFPGRDKISVDVYDNLLRPYLMFAVGVFGVAFVCQYVFVRRPEKDRLTHAGGVVYQVNGDAVEYLLVGPKKDVPNEWILPKGHIEPWETDGETALREIIEETGLMAKLIAPLRIVEFTAPEEEVRAKFYLMERLHKVGPGDGRRQDWFSFHKALKDAKHDQTKELLRAAEATRLLGLLRDELSHSEDTRATRHNESL
jgi:ADP-ribose pyrophosphatase YjhB (NUDIX family)